MSDPAWFTALIDQRVALVEDKVARKLHDPLHLIVTPLVEPEQDTKVALEFWERSCDNCRKFCPDNTDFYTGHIVRTLSTGHQLVMTFGVCGPCSRTFED